MLSKIAVRAEVFLRETKNAVSLCRQRQTKNPTKLVQMRQCCSERGRRIRWFPKN